MNEILDVLRIKGLKIRARVIVNELVSGIHRSRRFGFSPDFAEYRPYTPGEDIRFVDWKVYGRTGKLYVRKLYEEASMKSTLLLDVSASMGYGNPSKLEYARTVAAAMAYLLFLQRDAVGLITFHEKIEHLLRPLRSKRNLYSIFDTLERLKPHGRTATETPLMGAVNLLKRGMIIILSDLEADIGGMFKLASGLRSRGFDIIVFHILSKEEREIPEGGAFLFYDMETGERVPFNAYTSAQEYSKVFNKWLSDIRREFLRRGVDYHTVFTDTPFVDVLRHLLIRRK